MRRFDVRATSVPSAARTTWISGFDPPSEFRPSERRCAPRFEDRMDDARTTDAAVEPPAASAAAEHYSVESLRTRAPSAASGPPNSRRRARLPLTLSTLPRRAARGRVVAGPMHQDRQQVSRPSIRSSAARVSLDRACRRECRQAEAESGGSAPCRPAPIRRAGSVLRPFQRSPGRTGCMAMSVGRSAKSSIASCPAPAAITRCASSTSSASRRLIADGGRHVGLFCKPVVPFSKSRTAWSTRSMAGSPESPDDRRRRVRAGRVRLSTASSARIRRSGCRPGLRASLTPPTGAARAGTGLPTALRPRAPLDVEQPRAEWDRTGPEADGCRPVWERTGQNRVSTGGCPGRPSALRACSGCPNPRVRSRALRIHQTVSWSSWSPGIISSIVPPPPPRTPGLWPKRQIRSSRYSRGSNPDGQPGLVAGSPGRRLVSPSEQQTPKHRACQLPARHVRRRAFRPEHRTAPPHRPRVRPVWTRRPNTPEAVAFIDQSRANRRGRGTAPVVVADDRARSISPTTPLLMNGGDRCCSAPRGLLGLDRAENGPAGLEIGNENGF